MSKQPSVDGFFEDKTIKEEDVPEKPKETEEQDWSKAAERATKSAADPEDVAEWALIVDRSPTYLTIVSGILKSLNMGVQPFRDALAALNHLNQCDDVQLERVVAIFSELEVLGEMNGVEFLKALKSNDRTKAIPFVAVTNVKDREMIKASASLGIAGYVVKPFKETVIVERVTLINAERQKKK